MHDTALESGKLFFACYATGAKPRILDVGAMDVNGSLRSVAPEESAYVGMDLAAGNGVDVVLDDPHRFPFEDAGFDMTVSTSCFEHDDMFWLTFLEMVRVTRPGGYVYLSAPSNGPVHRYPRDSWRFYPDSGVALCTWAAHQGMPVVLVESLVLRRKRDVWNDCVAIFRREPADAPLPARLLADYYGDAQNVRTHRHEALRNAAEMPEDMELARNPLRALWRRVRGRFG